MGNLQVRFLEGWAPAMAPGYSTSARVEASGDAGADWFITGGQLPPGLSFDDSRISGTPTVGGSFNFEVTVTTFTSEVDNEDSRRFTVLILDVTTQTLPDGNVNQAYGPFTLGAIGLVGTPTWANRFRKSSRRNHALRRGRAGGHADQRRNVFVHRQSD